MAKKQKLTPWFPARINPARVGSYELGYSHNGGQTVTPFPFPYHWFHGKKWARDPSGMPSIGADPGVRRSELYSLADWYWRGLAEQPK